MLSGAQWERVSEGDAVKIKGIGYHRFNDFTVRMNDGGVRRYEGKIKESDGVKTLSDMLAASSSHSAVHSSSHSLSLRGLLFRSLNGPCIPYNCGIKAML